MGSKPLWLSPKLLLKLVPKVGHHLLEAVRPKLLVQLHLQLAKIDTQFHNLQRNGFIIAAVSGPTVAFNRAPDIAASASFADRLIIPVLPLLDLPLLSPPECRVSRNMDRVRTSPAIMPADTRRPSSARLSKAVDGPLRAVQ